MFEVNAGLGCLVCLSFGLAFVWVGWFYFVWFVGLYGWLVTCLVLFVLFVWGRAASCLLCVGCL